MSEFLDKKNSNILNLYFLYAFSWKIFVLNFPAETKAELQLYNLSYEYL